MDKKLEHIISSENLYKKTGIQKQMFNTVYQLMAFKEKFPELFDTAETFLMLPDYFNFLLTGIKKSEYTNATSTQIVNSSTRDWDWELIEKLKFNKKIFLPLDLPETTVGNFKQEIINQVGFDCKVIMTASHDTASAVISVPETNEINSSIYISSGTWSLMGIETDIPISTKESMNLNFSNEGGYLYKFRFLKNIMGLWIIQSVRNEINKQFSFSELCKMAESKKNFSSRINVNDSCFLSPKNMINEIQFYCEKTGQPIPHSIAEISSVVYHSLSDSYSKTATEIEKITNKKYEQINIIGGGSHADYLNQLTANKTGKTVYAGPSEASSLGNIIVQMIKNKEFSTLKEAKKSIYKSFEIRKYIPSN
jgi:rhamnulokinase